MSILDQITKELNEISKSEAREKILRDFCKARMRDLMRDVCAQHGHYVVRNLLREHGASCLMMLEAQSFQPVFDKLTKLHDNPPRREFQIDESHIFEATGLGE